MSELGSEPRRIVTLDVIRGFALLGILAVNAAYFAAPWQTGLNPTLPPLAVGDELWPWLAMHVFFEFKCITLFSMLFGASVYMVGGERSDRERGANLRRRLFWLMIFGAIHGALIWYGDILFTYAVTGFLVLFARSWRAPTLMVVGAVLYVVSVFVQTSMAFFFDHMPAEAITEMEAMMWTPPPEEVASMQAAYRGGFVSGVAQNSSVWFTFLAYGLWPLVLRTAAVMMLGMALFKWGFFSGAAPKWLYALMVIVGAAALSLIFWQALINSENGFAFRHMQTQGLAANIALSIFVSLGYASVLALIVHAGWRFITGPLAAVGRMAFTNYIAQSLIMTTIMWGGARGLGYWGAFDRAELWAIVVAIWLAQLIWSPLWLQHFSMGPLEWVWRRLTYKGGKRPA
ncbi:MAG: DUF418 domain-containing protein [Hyphomonadaceae bacterium]